MAQAPIRVSQVNQYIKRILQVDPILANLLVTGEVSNLKYHDTGNVYFTLKDEDARLSCFLPVQNIQNIRYTLADGMKVTAAGRINVYEKGGTFSLLVKDVEISGEGDLATAFFKLKEKLEKEGLFDPGNKKKIPRFCTKLVVITSETGAALRDIIKVIRNKNTMTEVMVFPCLVQGDSAAKDIAYAIGQVNSLFADFECIILARGGGSIEELWSFNEEIVARSIYESKIPLISAIGHETDFTIADFAADARASTPTVAAQMAVFDSDELVRELEGMADSVKNTFAGRIERLELGIAGNSMQMLKAALIGRAERYTIRIDHLAEMSHQILTQKTQSSKDRLTGYSSLLENLNPQRILERGYAAVTDKDGKFLRSVAKADKDDEITVILADGELGCLIREVRSIGR